jgi:hypothetical protein
MALGSSRALQVPELLIAVLEHLCPDAVSAADLYKKRYIGGNVVHSVDINPRAGLAALSAAARVSRFWHECAVPILWRRPSERALDVDAVPEFKRREYYAGFIRQVYLTRRSALWRALGGVSRCSGNNHVDGGWRGHDAGDDGGNRDGNHGSAGAAESCLLELPKL